MITSLTTTSSAISVLLNYMVFAYLEKLERLSCKCANINYSKILKSSILTNYIIIIGTLLFEEIPKPMISILTIYNIISSFSIFLYVRKLRLSNCKCSESLSREVIYFYYLVTFLLNMIIISMFLTLVISVTAMHAVNST